MEANSEFEDDIHGAEKDYFEFGTRDLSNDDDDGSENESGTGSDEDGDSGDFSIGTVAYESATPGAEDEPTAGTSTSGQSQAAGHGDGAGCCGSENVETASQVPL